MVNKDYKGKQVYNNKNKPYNNSLRNNSLNPSGIEKKFVLSDESSLTPNANPRMDPYEARKILQEKLRKIRSGGDNGSFSSEL